MILLPLNESTAASPIRARGTPRVPGPERLSRIAQQPDLGVVGQHLRDGAVVGALAQQVDWDDRRDMSAAGLEPLQRVSQQPRVHVAGLRVGVHEVWFCPDVADGVDGGGEGQCRDWDHVAWADAPGDQSQVQCCRPRRETYGELATHERGDLPLERVEIRPCRRDPPGLHRPEDVLLLQLTDVG